MISPSTVVVLITGANSGIGYAASKVIASASAKYHVIMASRSIEKGNAACSAIQAAGIKGTTSSIQLDVTDESSIAAAQLERTFSTNVVGAAVVAEAFTALLLKSAEPYLLHISSTLGSLSLSAEFDYGIDARAYRMSKAALNMLMVRDAQTLGKQGVKVFAVCPGLVESNLRGEGAQERSAGGKAGDPEVSGQTILRIMEGGRDADVGKFVNKDGVIAW
ncbi:MAG: hypothetical protein ASARMPREDX12_008785 [Alectoria sarmentosa]|nr:MAG: hypothetical protein ASARMPREDX12_008785 [Alectoria sarmentosa]